MSDASEDLEAEYTQVDTMIQQLFDSRLEPSDISGIRTPALFDMANAQLRRKANHFSTTGFNQFLYDAHLWCYGDMYEGSLDVQKYDVLYWKTVIEELMLTAAELDI